MKKLVLAFLLLLSLGSFSQSVTEVYYPRYVQGVGSGSPFNDLKVPYACRMTVSGLTPNATYRYYSRFVDNPASTLSNGVGSYILVNQTGNFTRVEAASMSAPGSYGEFTTSASGSYTGWFVVEPGSDIAFTPGNLLYWRIMLNNGAGGDIVATRVTATNSVTVINWGTNSGAALEGSAIYNAPNAAFTPKNFVMLYDNIAGTGRPVSGTFIESDGTTNTTAQFYDLFYELLVDGQATVWGTIIPNNLANGINNISQYSLANGNFVNKCTSPNGVYGATDTRNANKGNADPFTPDLLLINCTPNAGCSIGASATASPVNCFGQNTGVVNLTVTGGVSPFTYSWSNGATTEDLANVPAGVYTVIVTDASTCTATASATVTQPSAALNAASAAGTILCNGGTTTVTVTATGGTAPYTGTGVFTVGAGTYSYTVTDARGCTSVTSGTITQPAALSAASSAPPITTVGGSTTVTVTATGGTPPYTGTGTFTRTAGTYTFTVTDANGCSTTTTITLTDPSCTLSGSTTVTNVFCNGGNTGSIDLTVTGGTAPYTYSWSNGSTSQDPSGLAAGTYTVVITDANSCAATASATVTQPSALTAASSAPPITIVGGSTTVTVTASGGTPPYTGTGTFTRTAGSYTFTVTDANGCTTTTTITLSDPGCSINLSTVITNVSCNSGSNGAINLTVAGATAPVTYSWSNGATTEDISGLIAGNYTVTVTDGVGCSASITRTVNQPAALSAASAAGTILCNGGTTTVTVTATGGTAPYTGTGTFTVNAGAYSYTVTDANGCTSVTSGTIAQPTTLSATSTAPPITTVGGSTTVTVSATGGTPPYTGTGTFTRTAGTYTFTVTDANGCTTTTTITLTDPGCSIALSTTTTNVNCNGGNNGAIDLTVNGATPSINYSWSNGVTTQDISNLIAGTYTVTVTDNAGCVSVTSATITQPGALAASSAAGTILCNGGTTSVTVTASGGTSPYTGTGIFNVSAGTYSYTVTDANGCTSVTSGTITQPTALSATSTAPPITTVGGSTTVTVSATGGTPPYTGTGTFIRTAGTYTFTITDANGCTTSTTITLSDPSCNLTAFTAVTNILCNGANTGAINLTITGGTAPLTYSWSNGATTEDLANIGAGTYTVTITDGSNCITTASATVTQPAVALVAASAAGTIACNGGTTTVTVTATGGTAPYTGTGVFTVSAGTYNYTVTDANGCTSVTPITVTQPPSLVATATAGTIACNGGTTTITVTATGGTAPYTGTGVFTAGAGAYSYTVTDANGCTSIASGNITQPDALTTTSTAGTITCNGGTTTVTITASGGMPPYTGTGTFIAGAGIYSYTVTDASGCTSIATGTITQPGILTATATAGAISCSGGTTTVTVTAAGGTAPYTGTGTFTVNAGTYSYTVTDARGCTATASVTVGQPGVLTATATVAPLACNGGNTTVTISATGGTAPYTGTGTFTRGAGTYSFTVTDAAGCSSTTSVNITQPTQLVATATAPEITQCGGTTLVTVTATGGTRPYPFPGVGTYIRGPGNWSFTVTDSAGCTAVTEITIAAPECLVVYPNPVGNNSTMTVSHTGAGNRASIQVFNMSGARMISQAVSPNTILTTINVSRLAAGSYILIYLNDGEKKTMQFEKL